MKKVILTLSSALLIILTVQAQQKDTAGTKKTKQQQDMYYPEDQIDLTKEQRKPSNAKTGDTKGSDLVIVQHTEIPAALRVTLQNEEYEGWQTATIYQNKKTGEYLISPRPYRFSREGKPLPFEEGILQQTPEQFNKPQDTPRQSNRNRPQQADPGNDAEESAKKERDKQSIQQPTSDRESGQPTPQSNKAVNAQPQQSDRYRTDEEIKAKEESDRNAQEEPTGSMVQIEAYEFPASLRATLQDDQYKGWENGKMYFDLSNGEYLLILVGPESDIEQQKNSFRFDKNGKTINDKKSDNPEKDDQ